MVSIAKQGCNYLMVPILSPFPPFQCPLLLLTPHLRLTRLRMIRRLQSRNPTFPRRRVSSPPLLQFPCKCLPLFLLSFLSFVPSSLSPLLRGLRRQGRRAQAWAPGARNRKTPRVYPRLCSGLGEEAGGRSSDETWRWLKERLILRLRVWFLLTRWAVLWMRPWEEL